MADVPAKAAGVFDCPSDKASNAEIGLAEATTRAKELEALWGVPDLALRRREAIDELRGQRREISDLGDGHRRL